MDFKFCPLCGCRLQSRLKGDKKRLYCDPCGWTHYRNPTVGVAVVLLKNDELLLVRRNGSYEGMWCIPCGHVEYNEDIRVAAKREFKEETGLDVDIGPVFAVHSNFHDLENQTVGIWFLGTCTGGKLEAGSDASEVRFFLPDNLPEDMAFPTDLLVCMQLKSLIKLREKGDENDSRFISIIENCLPKMAPQAEIINWIEQNIDFSEFKNKMQAMGLIMKHFGATADGNAVKKFLQKM